MMSFLQQMGISQLTFTRIDIELKKDKNVVTIQRFDAVGPDMKINLKGKISLRNPVEKSIMSIKGEFQPDPSHVSTLSGLAAVSMLFSRSEKGIPFKITGTVEQPKLSL